MPDHDLLRLERLDLVDAVDHLLNKGAVLTGDATLSLAGVDLVYVGLNLLVASVETLRERGPRVPAPLPEGPEAKLGGAAAGSQTRPSADAVGHGPAATPLPASRSRRYADAKVPGLEQPAAGELDERPERGLARLVLTLIELLRRVLERQALRRVEGDALTEEQVERMGLALMELEAKMADLRAVFGLTEDDLTLDLGPLGRLQ